jgi:hypothetical protein
MMGGSGVIIYSMCGEVRSGLPAFEQRSDIAFI